jgi:hypothetical protein
MQGCMMESDHDDDFKNCMAAGHAHDRPDARTPYVCLLIQFGAKLGLWKSLLARPELLCHTSVCGCTASSTLTCEREDGAHCTFSVRCGDCGRATSDGTCAFACGRGGVRRHAQWGCRGSGGCAHGRTAGARVACRTVEMDRRDDGRRSRVHRCGACKHMHVKSLKCSA